jgi:hypothetical protein
LWEISHTGIKGVDLPLPFLFGLEFGWSQFELDLDPCQVLDLFNRKEALLCTPLSSSSLAAVEYGHLRLKHSDFADSKEIHRVVGPVCGL